jgi:Fe-S cluster biogenesis protein NfuA
MYIQVEETPNPSTLKFIPGERVMKEGTRSFTDAEEAMVSPLAARLFQIPGIMQVFFGKDFLSVSKEDDFDWYLLKPDVVGAIVEHFVSKQPIIIENPSLINSLNDVKEAAPLDALSSQIKELIDTRVRPAVAQDGGDIIFEAFVDGVVFLRMQGACSGCPSSTATLKSGIENMLRYYVPEVKEVRSVA